MSLLGAKQEEEVMAEINITPFTDVLLVLLIIFMILAALITPPGFEKQLPNKNTNPAASKPNPQHEIDIEVNDKGVIFVDGKKPDESGIYGVMAATAQKRGRLHVSITA